MLHWLASLPLLGVALLTAAAVAALAGRVEQGKRLYGLGSAVIIISWLVHLSLFIVQEYSLYEVTITSSEGMSLYYRIAASWSAGGGSLLLFSALLALFTFMLMRAEGLNRRGFIGASASVTAAAVVAGLFSGAYMATPTEGLGGLGLNPLLKSWWVFPHPLSTFIGYALSTAAALLLAFTVSKLAYRALLAGWGILTLGLVLGGMWSYETFGWGGYWAWDPVETAQLMVWLAVSASLHAVGPLATSRRPLMFTVVSSVFLALYVVRTGFSPLHSFAGESMAAIILLAVSLAYLAASFYVALKDDSVTTIFRRLPLLIYDRSPASFSLAVAGVALQAALLVVYSSLLIPSILAAMGYEAAPPSMAEGARFYNSLLFPLALLGLAVMPGYFLGARMGWRPFHVLLASSLAAAASLAIAVIAGGLSFSPKSSMQVNLMIAVGLPFAAVAFGSVVVGAARLLLSKRLVYIGGSLVHGGLALAMLGVLVSGSYAFNDSYTVRGEVYVGEAYSLGAVIVEVESYSYELSSDTIDPRVAVAYGYNSSAMALLALDYAARIVTPPDALSSGPGPDSLAGLTFDLGVAVLEASGAVAWPGGEAEGLVRVTLEGAKLYFTVLGDPPSIAGSPLTAVLVYDGLWVEVEGVEVGVKPPIAFVFLDGAELDLGSVKLVIYKALAGEERLAVGDGEARWKPGGPGVRLPAPVAGETVVRAIEAMDPEMAETLRESGVLAALSMAQRILQEGYMDSLPERVPAASIMLLEVSVAGKRVEGAIRYEANGEIIGIRGLVLDVEPVRGLLGDIYVTLAPPLMEGLYGVYPEPLIAYLRELRDLLSEEEFLAYAAMIAAGYTLGGIYNPEAAGEVLDTLVDFYILTSKDWAPEGYLNVASKPIPGVNLIWLGAALSLAGIMIDVLWPVAIGQDLAGTSRRREAPRTHKA